MGYPMTYARVVNRNDLNGPGYTHTTSEPVSKEEAAVRQLKSIIRGDMRRLEEDSRDEYHLKLYAEEAGITVEQAKKVLDHFFRLF